MTSLRHKEYCLALSAIKKGIRPKDLASPRILSQKINIEGDSCERVLSTQIEEKQFQTFRHIFGTPVQNDIIRQLRDSSILIPGEEVFLLQDAKIVGKTGVLCGNGNFYSTSYRAGVHRTGTLNRITQEKSVNGFIIAADDDGDYVISVGNDDSYIVDPPSLFLANLEPKNYGSFLIRVLPSILLANGAGISFELIVSPSRPSWLISLLQIIGLSNIPVFTPDELEGAIFTKLYLPMASERSGFIVDASRSRIRELVKKVTTEHCTAECGSDRDIFSSRLLTTRVRPDWRPLLNEKEVVMSATALGYQVVYPETLPLAGQIVLYSQASSVVGPSGSGLLNTIFCEPGTKVGDIESFHNTIPQHARLYSSTDKPYSFCFGNTVNDKALQNRPLQSRPWKVDLSHANRLLEWASGKSIPFEHSNERVNSSYSLLNSIQRS